MSAFALYDGGFTVSEAACKQLNVLTEEDKILCCDPEVTPWRTVIVSTAHFAMEWIDSTVCGGKMAFGETLRVSPNNECGSLLAGVVIEGFFPAIKGHEIDSDQPCERGICFPYSDPCDPCGDKHRVWKKQNHCVDDGSDSEQEWSDDDNDDRRRHPVFATWTNAVMLASLLRVGWAIGCKRIATIHRVLFYCMDVLFSKPGKRFGEEVGKYDSLKSMIKASCEPQEYIAEVPFSFATHSASAIPLCKLQEEVSIYIQIAPIEQLVIVSGPNVVVKKRDGSILTCEDARFAVKFLYVFLTEEEQAVFMDGEYTQLVEIYEAIEATTNSGCFALPASFRGPTKADIFVGRRKCAVEKNYHFNFNGPCGEPVIKGASLSLQGACRWRYGEKFMRTVLPRKAAQQVPRGYDKHIYSVYYCLEYTSPQNTGFLDMTCNGPQYIDVALNEKLNGDHVILNWYNVEWGVLQYTEDGRVFLLFRC